MTPGDRVVLTGEPVRYVGPRPCKGREGVVDTLGRGASSAFALVKLDRTKEEPEAIVEARVEDLEQLDPQGTLFGATPSKTPRAGGDPS